MQNIYEITLTSRRKLLQVIESHSVEQLNTIPPGFSNNLIWNIAHIIVVQQMLVYKLSGLPMSIDEAMVERFKRETKPQGTVDGAQIEQIKTLLFETIDQAQTDLAGGNFTNYTEFTTMSGYTIKTAQDAMAFNLYHEGVHMGIIMQIRKFL